MLGHTNGCNLFRSVIETFHLFVLLLFQFYPKFESLNVNIAPHTSDLMLFLFVDSVLISVLMVRFSTIAKMGCAYLIKSFIKDHVH